MSMPQSKFRFLRHSFGRVVAGKVMPVLALSLAAGVAHGQAPAGAQASATGEYVDPETGIVYRKVHRTIERPVVETQVRAQESTVYRPETVVEVRPETRTVYSPVVTYGWEPRLKNRWNPFMQPTVQYEHVPRMHWEARSETVERRQTRTNWVAEHRRVDVPQQVVKIQREEKVDLEPVGRVAPQEATPPNSAEAAIAARLRPLDSTTYVNPISTVAATSGPVGGATRRSNDQLGIRATELYPAYPGGYSTTLPPVGVARTPFVPIYR